MATFVAKNSGAVKKKSVIILKEFIFFVLVSTSSASDWQGCEDSHWIKRTTFVFHKIAIYNNCKLFLNLKAIWRFIKNITYSRCSKAFSVMAWNWGQNRSLHFISCVFLCEAYVMIPSLSYVPYDKEGIINVFIKTILPWLSNIYNDRQ